MTISESLETLAAPLSKEVLDQLFRKARSHAFWLPRPVDDNTLRKLYDLMKWGPTSSNGCPARILFLRTPEAKHRLVPALASSNVKKVLTAPVTAIIGFDLHFYNKLPKLFPHAPGCKDAYAKSPELAEVTALRNSSLQGAYLMLAARALGLDCGAVSGFDNAKVDEEFFGTRNKMKECDGECLPVTHTRSNFLCNIGYGDHSRLFPQHPRLDFEEACALL